MRDTAKWNVFWRVEKWHDGQIDRPPDEVAEFEGNLLTTAGANALWTALTGGSITPFNTANAYIGVGDGTAAASASQTDLQGTNKVRLAMDSGYPTVSGNAVTFKATADGSTANFAWNEFGVFNASSGGTMLNRKVQNLGTKTSGAAWSITVTITLS